VLLGKLNTHELAFGVTTNNPHFGATRNPWSLDRIPGGSSGGSGAAVAAGLVPFAMGTDTGGSIRIPASLCGVVGLKPTYGRVSTAGILPLSWSLDHAGPLTRTVEDAAIVLNAIAGPDDRDPQTPPVPVPDYRGALNGGVDGLHLGVPRAGFFDELDPEVAVAVELAIAVLRDLGAEVADIPETPAIWEGRQRYIDILLPEARFFHTAALETRPQDFGADVLARLGSRTDTTAAELVAAMRARDAAIQEASALLRRFDALLTPATPIPAPEISDDQTVVQAGKRVLAASVLTRDSGAFNTTGMPALSLPCGFTSDGLPIGLQIAGNRWDESTVLRVAATYERATPWHLRRPA
jgi:aspartyl-tRNA(Asn)/glutamyl-tRNA(Gln) amidotransferase subunit A